jgi:peptidylprolyl isomerase
MKSHQPKHAVRLVAAAALALASAAAHADANTPVASTGSVTVKQQDVQMLMRSMPEADRAAVKANPGNLEGWLRQRVATQAVLQEAQGKGWDKRPEVKAQIDAAVRDVTENITMNSYLESVAQVPADYPNDADLRNAYDRAKDNFKVPATFHLAQIFVAGPANDPAAVEKARTQAQALAAQAKTGDFADLARKNSQDQTSAQQGGDVGNMPLNDVLPEARDTVTRLKKGEVSAPVQSNAGFHILKLIDTNAPRTASFNEVRPRLTQVMRQQRQQELVQAYLAKLAPPASIKIDPAALDAAVKGGN